MVYSLFGLNATERRFFSSLSPPPRLLINILLVLFTCSTTSATDTPVIDPLFEEVTKHVTLRLPEYGTIMGKRVGGVDFFGGLPYAAPPIGDRRFAGPEPPTPWAPARLDATQYGPDCWQVVDPVMNPQVHGMSEDCLSVNVFAPAGSSSNRRVPVMVWLHGGAFQLGGAHRPEYDGRLLAERGVVVVTLNYRLGALGFLVSRSDGITGNFGLMDQRAALYWVRDHIAVFGGDPDNVTLFGESAGGVMALLHLLMASNNSTKRLFHKVIIQSNPVGLQFRSVVVADFIGQALKTNLDCRDLTCLRAEPVEEILKAQSSLMGVPRSVGDFFTWGPTQTSAVSVTLLGRGHDQPRGLDQLLPRHHDHGPRHAWATVNVSQPLKNVDANIPDDIPIIIGTNKNEGEMFVHGAFPFPMSKVVYWMFVGALFRDSASRVLQHYRGIVEELEAKARELAYQQLREEENRQFYLENKEALDREYQHLIELNMTRTEPKRQGYETLFETWSRGGATTANGNRTGPWLHHLWPFRPRDAASAKAESRRRQREERKREREKSRFLKEAGKVVVDYRPVMSRIIDDYLFRCPSWHLAHKLSRNRFDRGQTNNVFVYRFSHNTHIPGFSECWGKSCHTAELPFVFQAMDVIRSNYSTLGPHAQREAPTAPNYPYSETLAAYHDAMKFADPRRIMQPPSNGDQQQQHRKEDSSSHGSKGFNRLLGQIFGDYFKEDVDEEIAADMAERWVAFAKTGDPNYEASQAKWHPWRYVFDDELEDNSGRDWSPQDFDDIFDLNRIQVEENYGSSSNETVIEGYMWSSDPVEQTYRRRALIALGMEVVEEDLYQTQLRKIKFSEETDNPFHAFLTSLASSKSKRGKNKDDKLRKAIRQLQRMAQDMGFLGTGIRGTRREVTDYWKDAFFPEMLELKWPPEGRLLERDCTCDLCNVGHGHDALAFFEDDGGGNLRFWETDERSTVVVYKEHPQANLFGVLDHSVAGEFSGIYKTKTLGGDGQIVKVKV